MTSSSLGISLVVLALSASACGGTKVANPRDASPDSAEVSHPSSDGSNGDGSTDKGPADVGPADVGPADMRPAEMARVDAAADVSAADVAADVSLSDGLPPDAAADRPSCVDVDGSCVGTLALFNTGVNASGAPLEGGSVDPHYKLIQSADSTLPGPDAIVTSKIADGYWVPQSATGKWIAPSADQSYPGPTPCNAAGTYVYRTTFDLTGYDPATAKITGQWAADNVGTALRLNGVSTGITAGSYTPLTPFIIDAGFKDGTNTLEFEVLDSGCPNGLRVELSGTAVVGGGSGGG